MLQLKANNSIVEDMINKTNFTKENTWYLLIYFIRNTKLIISDVNDNVVEYEKEKGTTIEEFIKTSLLSYGVLY